MRLIAKEQAAIGWTIFAEDRVTRRNRDMQALYMGNLNATYTVDHWMREFVRKLCNGSIPRNLAGKEPDEAP